MFRATEMTSVHASDTMATTPPTSKSRYCCPRISGLGSDQSASVPIASRMRSSVGPIPQNDILNTVRQYVARYTSIDSMKYAMSRPMATTGLM